MPKLENICHQVIAFTQAEQRFHEKKGRVTTGGIQGRSLVNTPSFSHPTSVNLPWPPGTPLRRDKSK